MKTINKKNLAFALLLSMIGFSLSFSKVPVGSICNEDGMGLVCYQPDPLNPKSAYCKPASNPRLGFCKRQEGLPLPPVEW